MGTRMGFQTKGLDPHVEYQTPLQCQAQRYRDSGIRKACISKGSRLDVFRLRLFFGVAKFEARTADFLNFSRLRDEIGCTARAGDNG